MRKSLLTTLAFTLLFCQAASAENVGYPPLPTTRNQITAPQPRTTGYNYDPEKTGEYYKQPQIKVEPKEQPITLGTPTSFEVGAQFSRYQYQELGVGTPGDTTDVFVRGLKYGIDGRFTYNINDWFFQLEGRFAGGDDDYKGSGKLNGVADDLAEGRLLAGHDFLMNQFGVSPYLGVGFRDLFNDSRGTTTTGAIGYKRENQLLYMPVGFTARTRVDQASRISLNFEYDQFLWGRQYSDLNDVNILLPQLVNSQTWGYGLRGELLYERRSWGIGPFFNYWNINQSEDGCASRITMPYKVTSCGNEPHNSTVEYGLRFRYRIF